MFEYQLVNIKNFWKLSEINTSTMVVWGMAGNKGTVTILLREKSQFWLGKKSHFGLEGKVTINLYGLVRIWL